MRYAQIREIDISDGPGVRVGIYTQGCSHHCHNCYNQETWDYNGGHEWTKETNDNLIKLINKPFIKGLSILGGDPICTYLHDEENNYLLLDLLKDVKNLDKSVWLWTGYLMEDLLNKKNPLQQKINPLLQQIDVIIDGPYDEKLQDLHLSYRGSSNQRVINVQDTLRENTIVLY